MQYSQLRTYSNLIPSRLQDEVGLNVKTFVSFKGSQNSELLEVTK